MRNCNYIKRCYDLYETKVNGEGSAISGQDDTVYKKIAYGENSAKDIVITPDYGYKISTITVNDKI